MWPSLNNSIPLLCIDNIYDYYKSCLNRYTGPNEAKDSYQNLCARFVLFGGRPKLIVCQEPVVIHNYLREHLGLEGDIFIIPNGTAESTVERIIQCPRTLKKIVEFSGLQKEVQVIGWAGTSDMLDLANHLEEQFGVTVTLPETPSKENLWIQKYLDTKHGFRSVVSTTFCPEEEALPTGFICLNEYEMLEAVKWYLSQDQDCIVKPDQGMNGRGIFTLNSNNHCSEDEILRIFDTQRALFSNDPIIVEQRISRGSREPLSPSVEYYIPPKNQGNPVFTYLVNQVFVKDVYFVGSIISKEQYDASWCSSLLEKGDRLARKVQELGYVGYIDIDCIVDENNKVYFVEVNPRRTGGTHIHEVAVQLFGENYIQEISLISNSHLEVQGIFSFEELYAKTFDLLYVPQQEKKGIIITNANLLASYGVISALSIGKDECEATDCLLRFQARISSKDVL